MLAFSLVLEFRTFVECAGVRSLPTSRMARRTAGHNEGVTRHMRTKVLTLLVAACCSCRPVGASRRSARPRPCKAASTDTTGAVVPGATVTVTGPALIGGARTTVTRRERRLPLPRPAARHLPVSGRSFQGFKTFTRENVRLELGQTITVDAQLEIGGVPETVTVDGRRAHRRRDDVGGAEEPDRRDDGDHPVHAAASARAPCCSRRASTRPTTPRTAAAARRRTPT